jgi:hypothetical protein
MKKFLIFCLFIVLYNQTLYSQVRVSGYTRKNGTYVQPHMRSNPNSNPFDNYSFPGNTNPYTGKTSNGNSDTYLYNYYNRNNRSNNNNYSNTGLLKDVNPYMGTKIYSEPILQNYSNTTINNNYNNNNENISNSTPQKKQPVYKNGDDEIYKSDTYKYYSEKNKKEELINNQDIIQNQENGNRIKSKYEKSKELNDWYENEIGKKNISLNNNNKKLTLMKLNIPLIQNLKNLN